MKKTITISIQEPCHEDWQEMTPTQKGKFCDSCAKEVFDFTDKSDEQIVAFVAKNSNVCGRFKKNQTERELKMERKSGFHLAPYAASLLLPITLLGNSNSTPTSSNSSKSKFVSLGIGRYSDAGLEQKKIQYSGVVRDENGHGVSNVKISVKETGASVVSGLRGHYKISLLNHQTLIFQKKGFETVEIRTSKNSEEKNIVLGSQANSLKNIVGKIATTPVEINTVTIQGTLTDAQNTPIPGVYVLVNGTTIGTQTDFDGFYSIEAQPGSQLVYSYVGYEERRATISNIDTVLNIQLNESYNILGEIVIMGGIGNEGPMLPPQLSTEEKAAKKLQRESAYKNEIEFQKLKQERKKMERLKKRAKRRN
ncbi:carboxypeptidase-like regulatory domain-containing protein [Cochleicola gelatinilyticus]|uniref:TonB-dependent receptor plug domain-containing protein n=1 Tax=Cochleicola gelatinilyticus TaxID=1763537 RepID=A0A167HFN4_9FLAO|nr:carboxypeptidase-like regulatory domain-containing protein [Cochleicola gelatinilyticus]OAB78556.1 hypothetical protein ULVI_08165 [Cochleicola gelatinilyticus]